MTSRSWALRTAALLTIFAGALVVMSPTLKGEFLNWDDDRFVVENQYADALTTENIAHAFGGIRFESYQPLALVSYMVDGSLWPGEARLYRLHSLLLFLIGLALLYSLLTRLGFEEIPAWVACLFFALAPSRVESVAWIAARKDVLALLFSLAAWHFHLSGDGARRCRFLFASLAALSMAAALLSKSAAIVVPFMILTADVGLRGTPFRRALLRSTVYLPLVAAVAVLVPLLWSQSELIREPVAPGPWGRLALVAWSFDHYLRTALWPFNLSPLYAEPTVDALNLGAAGGLGAAAAITGALFVAHKKRLAVAQPMVAVAWFSIGQAPFLNAIPMYYLVADRYLLFASLGVALLAGSLVRWSLSLKRPRHRLMLMAGLAAVAISWGVAANGECRAWTTSKSLWLHAVTREPDSFYARLKFGETLMSAGEHEEASAQYREARRIRPLSPSALGGLFNAELHVDTDEAKLGADEADRMLKYFLAIADDGPKLVKFRSYLKKRGLRRAARVVSTRLE